jgi:hypothetical protein
MVLEEKVELSNWIGCLVNYYYLGWK